MMQVLPQTTSIHTLKHHMRQVLDSVRQGPVMIMNRSEVEAVVVSPGQWNATAERLMYLERILRDDQTATEMRTDPMKARPFTKAELIKQGLIDG